MSHRPPVSPDGLWWWDGTAWRPTPVNAREEGVDRRIVPDEEQLLPDDPRAKKQPLTLGQLVGLLVGIVIVGACAWIGVSILQDRMEFADQVTLFCEEQGDAGLDNC